MKKRSSNPQSIQNSLHELEKISKHLKNSLSNNILETVYDNTIKALAESPYMFNYYHWITDFKESKYLYVEGLKEALGYADEAYNPLQHLEIIHPNYRPIVVEYARNAYQMLGSSKYHAFSSKAHYSIQYPVLNANNVYVLVQLSVSVLIIDTTGFPLANYNRSVILGEYRDEPVYIRPTVYFSSNMDVSTNMREAEQELIDKLKPFILDYLDFTDIERKVLSSLSDKSKTVQDIAEELGNLSGETIKVYNKRILEKARQKLSPSFRDARTFAMYLHDIGIL